MTEQQIQKKIIKWLEDNSYYVIKIVTANKSGVPDIIACDKDGKFVAIEVKTPKTKNNTSKLQEYNIKKINDNNGTAFVAYSIECLINKLR